MRTIKNEILRRAGLEDVEIVDPRSEEEILRMLDCYERLLEKLSALHYPQTDEEWDLFLSMACREYTRQKIEQALDE